MGIRIVFLGIQVGLVIEQPVEDVGGIALGALDRYGVEWRVIVGNEGVELQRIVPQAMTIGTAEDPPREEEALPIAAGGAAIAPHLGRVQGRDSIDQIGK